MKKAVFILVSVLMISGLCDAQIGGYSLYFDGSDDYISVPHNSNLNFTAFTIEAWIYPTGTDSKIMGKTAYGSAVPGFSMGYTSDYKLFCECKQDWGSGYVASTSTATASLNTWSHVAMTWSSGGYLKAYINGVEVINVASASLSITNSNYFVIGRAPWISPNQGAFKGRMDEVRVWNVVRTQSEIKSTMFKELAGNETGLRIYFKMSNGSGSTVTDNQTNVTANTGTNNGAIWKASGCFAGPKKCLSFDGNTKVVVVPYNAAFEPSNYTIEAWVNSPSMTSGYSWYQTIFGNGKSGTGGISQGFELRCGAAKIELVSSVPSSTAWNTISTPVPLANNTWYYVSVVYSGGYASIYINGRLVTGPVNIGSYAAHGSTMDIGIGRSTYWNDYNNWRSFSGYIDEVKFWNTARTEAQIREGMCTTLTGTETGLAAYYRFDYYDGTTLYDITSNGLNGTLTNMSNSDWITSTAYNTWIGSESNAWSTAANWSTGAAPVSTDNVGIFKWSLGNELSLSSTPTLNHMIFSSTSSPTLNSNFTVNGELTLNKDIDLNGYTITLGTNGYLNEGSYRLYGTSGTITTTRNLAEINGLNVGGLGAVISTNGDMGSTTITRGHALQGYSQSIYRYYDITPTINTGLNATLVFNYNDNELNGIIESDLRLFRSTNSGINWTLQSASSVNTTNNTITLTGINAFSRWTASSYNSAMPVELVSFVSSVHGKNIELMWKTSKEINNKGFEIERKLQGGSWVTAGFISGKGNTNEASVYTFTDKNLNSGKYNYRLKQEDYNGNYNYYNLNSEVEIGIPSAYRLLQNYPNPFNPVTSIDFELPKDGKVSLKVYDITGKEVMCIISDEFRKAGYYTSVADGSSLGSGVYFYRLTADNFSSVKKMILVK